MTEGDGNVHPYQELEPRRRYVLTVLYNIMVKRPDKTSAVTVIKNHL